MHINQMIIEWVEKIKATNWLLNIWIPDGNQNTDQKSLVRLSISYIHVENVKMQMEFCV